MRSRFGHGGYECAQMLTVSCSNSLFKNLYFMHGSSTGADAYLNLLTVTGDRNAFVGCNFAGPMDPDQAHDDAYNNVYINGGSHNYFKDCTFGAFNMIHRDVANTILKFGGTGANWGNVFEDCIFYSRSAATTPYFINISSTAGGGQVRGIFLNCQFINVTTLHGSYDLTVAIVSTPTNADENYLYFDSRSSFAGVTDIIVSGKEGIVWFGSAGATADDAAVDDLKKLGLSQNPVTS